MKKVYRIIAAVLCAAMLMCGMFLQSFASTIRFNTNDAVRLYGDIDGDGVIEQSDFDYILGIVSGEIEMPAVGTPEYYAADIMGDGITMEDARRCYRYLKGLDTVETYSPDERELELFNDLVNIIKTEEFDDNLIYYIYEYEFMETKDIDFGAFTSIITGAMSEEDTETEKYYRLRIGDIVYMNQNPTTGVITSNYPCLNRSVVSTLTLDDIQDISIEVGVPCTFSADANVPASIVSNNVEYDLTGLTAKEAVYTDCIKITIEINDESYVNDVPADIKALAKKQLVDGVAEGETPYLDLYQPALYNLYGTDIIELGAQYPLDQKEEADGMSTRICAELGDIKTGAGVVYYFDRATLNPIAASYLVETDIDQHVEMSMSFGSMSLDGTMNPRNLMIMQYNYWFYEYFKDAVE